MAQLDNVEETMMAEINEIYARLKDEDINVEPEEALCLLGYCNTILPRVCEMLVVAEGIVRQAQGEASSRLQDALDEEGKKISQRNFDRQIEMETDTQIRAARLVERLSATLDKRIKSLITAISYGKQIRGGQR